jgi:magnesium-transporting ATPase (P-type)
MFKLFQYKKETLVKVYPVWHRMQTAVDTKTRQLADCLNRQTAKISRRSMIIILVIFCLCWSAASIAVLIKALQRKEGKLAITAIAVPKSLPLPLPLAPLDTATLQALKRIAVFQQYLDSLKVYNPDKYRELQNSRPGLLDSIGLIQHYYSKLK